jgi:predicted enzyme related to lactoylglutathione lyase
MARMTNGIGWFQIGVPDMTAAQRFYGDLFGWTFTEDSPQYHIVATPVEESIKGGIWNTGGEVPNHAIFCVEVEDVADTVRRTEAAGGKVIVPVTTGKDGLVFADVLDPFGNHFGVYSPAPSKGA